MSIKTTSERVGLDPIEIAALRARLRGDVLVTGAPAYEAARRLANGRFDRRPAIIVRPLNAQDVAHAVVFAREHGLEIAVRSGGHSVPGHSAVEGGMLIDLSAMRQVAVNQGARVARVQPGVTNGELVLALQEYGLATTTGTCATVGMGGSTLGGGIGWLMGRFGATVDNVLAFEVV
ncbi:MAG TPA: FAD-dependent oxidoreductase, partial [Chloroflexaceae bacterium]|nr:FAD-dependent oxidoreductase [Chloroflexaceae bacterium]